MSKYDWEKYYLEKYFLYNIYQLQKNFPDKMTKEEMYNLIKYKECGFGDYIDQQDYSEYTPLTIEILLGKKEDVETLENSSCSFDESVIGEFSPAMLASYLRKYDMAEYLYSKKDVNYKNHNGIDLLKIASASGDIDLVNKLIKDGVLVNDIDDYGNNALFYSSGISLNGKLEDRLVTLNIKNVSDLRVRRLNVFKILIENGVDVNHESKGINLLNALMDDTSLPKFSSQPTDEMVKMLVDAGCKKDVYRTTPTNYEQDYSFKKLVSDIKDKDLSLWPDLPRELVAFKRFKKIVRENKLNVFDGIFPSHSDIEKPFVMTYKDGKKIK